MSDETRKDGDRYLGEMLEQRPGDAAAEAIERARSGLPLAPLTCSASGVEAEVCADIAARQSKGIAKYGTTVADNPLELKEWLQHAYEETLDKAVYLKKAIAVINETPNAQAHTQEGRERGPDNQKD